MGWDEKIFGAGLDAIRSLLTPKVEVSPSQLCKVSLSEVSVRLRMLASALGSRSIEIKEAESIGGPIGDTLFLPESIALAADRELNLSAYLYRTAYSVTLAGMKGPLPEEHRGDSYAQVLTSLLTVPVVCSELQRRYPGLMRIEGRLRGAEAQRLSLISSGSPRFLALRALALSLICRTAPEGWAQEALSETPDRVFRSLSALRSSRENPLVLVPVIWGLVLPASGAGGHGKSSSGAPPTSKENGLPVGTERKGKPRENTEEVKLAESKEDENPLVHVFEKVRTLDDYAGGKKMLDGSDELEEQLEALQELDLRRMIRARERTQSIYKADVVIEGGVGDSEDGTDADIPAFYYSEWDFRARKHRENWCKVYMDRHVRDVTSEQVETYVREALRKNARQIRDLRRKFEELTYVRRWRTRQPDGPEIDMDAVVDRYATLRSGHSPGTSLYLSRRPRERDYATLVLLDSSLSTDSWLRDRRVMDVLKESMLVLGEVAAEFRDRMAIGAFYSNTRNDCRYIEVKGFEENWRRCQAKLVGLHPTGYTRIGPALRHGVHLLSQVKARKKLMLLISDGKPTDYDRYEGRYGIEDIRQAVREASKENVTVRGLAVESQAKFYLPQMFGVGNFQILPNPDMLARALAQIYGWLSV